MTIRAQVSEPTFSADVAIVGSGVAGSLVAARLARAGVKVLILEAGPRVQRPQALAQYREASIKIPECAYPETPYAPRPKSDDPDYYDLMDHPSQLSWALAAEPVWPYRGPLSTGGIESTRAGDWRADHAAFRVQLDNKGWSWPMDTPDHTVRELAKQGLRGAELERVLAERSSREIAFATMSEQLPSPDNRIVPDFDRRDAPGMPRPRITFRIDDYTRRSFEHGRRIHREIYAALKATDVQHGDADMASGHVIGTYRMGADARQSVVNPDQRAHDHPNLFLLGSGVFPTSAASNPTLTIAALALRALGPIRGAV